MSDTLDRRLGCNVTFGRFGSFVGWFGIGTANGRSTRDINFLELERLENGLLGYWSTFKCAVGMFKFLACIVQDSITLFHHHVMSALLSCCLTWVVLPV